MSGLSFADLPDSLTGAEAPAVVVPIPFEKTVTWQPGTRNGPTAILRASSQVEFYDEVLKRQTARVGIRTASAIDCRGSLKDNIASIRGAAEALFQAGRFPVFLGGEHSISVGVFEALRQVHGPVTIVQVDAHADLRETYHGSPLNHACVMARAREAGHRVIQLGIRALSQREAERINHDPDIVTFFDHDRTWREQDLAAVWEALDGGPVYLTIDVDGLDPAIMPATGTPVPGGLTWREINQLVSGLFQRAEVLGADLNELKPDKQHRHCDFLCARLAYRIIGEKALQADWPFLVDPLNEED